MPGEILELHIDKVVYGGDGLGRVNGQTIFVPFSAPGDDLRVRVVESRRSYRRAVIEEILTPSSVRRPAPCPHFGVCGGCQIQHLNYPAQLESKVGFVKESLRRIGHIDWTKEITIIHADEWGYRARAQFKIDYKKRIGFYRSSSHEVKDIDFCPLLRQELNDELTKLRDERDLLDNVEEVEVATADSCISKDVDLLDEPIVIMQSVGNLKYRFDARTFFQVNPNLLDKMIDIAVGDANGDLAVDLYCGVGLFTVPLSKRFGEVIAVEGNERSARFAAENVKLNGSSNVSVYASSIEDWLVRNSGGSHELDFLLLDPPRAGVEPNALEDLIATKPATVSYVSCDPTTLARDLRGFVSAGYSIDSITAIDMFPQTFHIETCVRMTR